jgi:hypothetical protein
MQVLRSPTLTPVESPAKPTITHLFCANEIMIEIF